MTRLVVSSRVGADGVLNFSIPLGVSEAHREVEVTVQTMPPKMTQEEWREFVLSMAGSIDDPTFIRHDQGEYEQREALP